MITNTVLHIHFTQQYFNARCAKHQREGSIKAAFHFEIALANSWVRKQHSVAQIYAGTLNR